MENSYKQHLILPSLVLASRFESINRFLLVWSLFVWVILFEKIAKSIVGRIEQSNDERCHKRIYLTR